MMNKKERAAYGRKWRTEHSDRIPNSDPSVRKTCPKCKTEMPATVEFFGPEKATRLGLSSYCRKCMSLVRAAYNKAHRQEVNIRQQLWRKRTGRERVYTLRGHKMTMEEFDALLKAQNGVCAICGNPPIARDKFVLHVDHVHDETQRNRGLLCIRCNQSIERIENDPEWGTKALNYLARFIEQTVKV